MSFPDIVDALSGWIAFGLQPQYRSLISQAANLLLTSHTITGSQFDSQLITTHGAEITAKQIKKIAVTFYMDFSNQYAAGMLQGVSYHNE